MSGEQEQSKKEEEKPAVALSMASKAYDRGNKGYLDETEKVRLV